MNAIQACIARTKLPRHLWDSDYEDELAQMLQAQVERRADDIMYNPEERREAIKEFLLDDEKALNLVADALGKLILESESKLTEAEKDQGILDQAVLVLIPLAKEALLVAAAS